MKRKKVFTVLMKKKLTVSWFLFMSIFFVLIARITYINQTNGTRYAKKVMEQQSYDSRTIPFKRGDIVDRNGNVLAISEKVYNVIIEPKNILYNKSYLEPTVKALVDYFEIDENKIRKKIKDNPNSKYTVIEKKVSYEMAKKYLDFKKNKDKKVKEASANVRGIYLEESYERRYPNASLACDVLGFVLKGNLGNGGLEGRYDDALNGTNGRQYGFLNENQLLERTTIEATNGNTLVTTLDITVQSIVEEEIKKFNDKYGSLNTGVIAMNPQNGEIYAMASYPVFDCNNPRDLSGLYTEEEIENMNDEEQLNALNDLWNNFCISKTYEPGSTFKPMTTSMGLEETSISKTETFNCTGSQKFGPHTIKCHGGIGHGTVTLEDSIAASCNIAMMEIVETLGKEKFVEYLNSFGFGQKTGIDLPGEAEGILYSVDNMGETTLATNSFGQNFTCTMMQLAAAFSSVVNGGYYYEPHLVKQIKSDDGAVVEENDKKLVNQVISSSVSTILDKFMIQTVERGTGVKAHIDGYSIAGKTGTAQKGKREDKKYVISFASSVPAENPELVLYVVIDEPKVPISGTASYATEVAHDILEKVLPYLNIYPTK